MGIITATRMSPDGLQKVVRSSVVQEENSLA